MSETEEYKVGDRVICPKGPGTIEKFTAARSAAIRLDNGDREVCRRLRFGYYRFRRETEDDVTERNAEEAHRAAYKAWLSGQPVNARYVHGSASWASREVNGCSIPSPVLETVDEMRSAAKELNAFADWFARKPVCP